MAVEVMEKIQVNSEQVSDEEKKSKRRERISRPQRRYGIEVDRVEDVGVIVMCDGIHPAKSMTMEEYLSIPKEIRDKANAELEHFFKNHKTTFPAAIKKVVRDQLARGTPISYGDKEGNVLRRYPDGRIFLVDMNMETFETTETFLRMATPEDNYWDR